MQLFYLIIAKRRAKIEKNDYMKFSSFLSIYLLRDSFILRKENFYNILFFFDLSIIIFLKIKKNRIKLTRHFALYCLLFEP